jgi:hypothetical protein
MQINGSLPAVLSSSTEIGSAGLQAEQRKAAPVAGEQPQTENAIKPSDGSDAASSENTADANRKGRGRLVDLKV